MGPFAHLGARRRPPALADPGARSRPLGCVPRQGRASGLVVRAPAPVRGSLHTWAPGLTRLPSRTRVPALVRSGACPGRVARPALSPGCPPSGWGASCTWVTGAARLPLRTRVPALVRSGARPGRTARPASLYGRPPPYGALCIPGRPAPAVALADQGACSRPLGCPSRQGRASGLVARVPTFRMGGFVHLGARPRLFGCGPWPVLLCGRPPPCGPPSRVRSCPLVLADSGGGPRLLGCLSRWGCVRSCCVGSRHPYSGGGSCSARVPDLAYPEGGWVNGGGTVHGFG
ncbi:hypothetical protein EHYA_06545 [Embleya hyalina]|uniref:Uncharacterized protein n=1 Tax=Embleya hyalina TaxID=516124 RepID=A0A401YW55_9ACTN|nr:hypothetical protein EHYA_06545 [Embleya hyalina]